MLAMMTVGNEARNMFLELYDSEASRLFRHIEIRVRDRERAKDIVQEAFCRVWSAVSRGTELENSRAFLYRVARNVLIDAGRKKREELFADPGDADLFADTSMTGKAERESEYAHALEAISTLSKEYREAVTMRLVDDLSPKEISEILGVSANVVSVRITRGVAELRRRLGDENVPKGKEATPSSL